MAFMDFTTLALLKSVAHSESSPGADLAERIRAIRRDPRHPYNDKRSPERETAVREMADLYGRLFSDQGGEPEL